MKKLLFLSFIAAGIMASCGGHSAEQHEEDSIHIVDSIAAAEAAAEAASEQARLDSIRQDSIAQDMFNNALTINLGKKKLTPVMNSECMSVTLPVTVTNNTDIALSASDYKITYTSEEETSSDGSSPNAKHPRTAKTQSIAPGESITITLKENCAVDINKVKTSLKLSKEEFSARRNNK